MRLLFYSNVFPNPLESHRGAFNRHMIRAIADHHPVRVISPVSWFQELSCRLRNGVSIDRERLHLIDGTRTTYPRFYYPPKIFRSRYDLFLEWSTRRELDDVIRQFRPRAILSYWAHPDGTVALKTAHRHGLPCIIMVGGSDVLLLSQCAARRRAILKTLLQADAVITVSDDIRRQLVQWGVKEERLHVVHRGVDSHIFHKGSDEDARRRLGISHNDHVLVTVGRLVPVKGHEYLIEACRKLGQRGMAPHVYMIGDGELRPRLTTLSRQYGLTETMHFIGQQTQSQLADWYRAADCVVLPSLSEGLPNVLLEAIHCGARFIASRVGGIPEIADPNFDRLVPAADAASLAVAIEEQLQLPMYPGERWFLPQTWEKSASEITSIIQRCINDNKEDVLGNNRSNQVTTAHDRADNTDQIMASTTRK